MKSHVPAIRDVADMSEALRIVRPMVDPAINGDPVPGTTWVPGSGWGDAARQESPPP